MEEITTAQVAQEIGKERAYIITLLSHYPELKPARRVGKGKRSLYLWSTEEIENLKAHIAGHSRGKK